MNIRKTELDEALITFEKRLEIVNQRIAKMEKKFLPQLRARKLARQSNAQFITQKEHVAKWFDGLAMVRENPSLKYVSNSRYQNICAKIEKVERELRALEESCAELDIEQEENDEKSDAKATINENCDMMETTYNHKPSQRVMEHATANSENRCLLIADIHRILPEIRQQFM